MSKKVQLQEQRASIANEMKRMVDAAESENRGFGADEDEKWAKMEADIAALDARIEKVERSDDLDEEIREASKAKAGRFDRKPEEKAEEKREEVDENVAFAAFLRGGLSVLTPEQRAIMAERQAHLTPEQRALSVGTTTAGGFTVPEDFYNAISETMLAFGGMRQANSTILSTASGADLPIPTNDDTSNVGAILTENTQVSEADVVFGQKVLNAYMYSSNLIRVSYQLLQDSAFDLNTWLARKLGERLGRITNTHFTTGTGTGQPNGVVTASTLGKTGTTGQTTSVIYDDLVDLFHAVDPAYRMNAQWMLADSSIKAIKKLKDSQQLPIWRAGLVAGDPDEIMGKRYVVNNDVPAMAANAKSILFGDFSQYFIRDVLGVQVLRLQERYADFLQVGFLAFSRHDGELIQTGAVKHYANSAT